MTFSELHEASEQQNLLSVSLTSACEIANRQIFLIMLTELEREMGRGQ